MQMIAKQLLGLIILGNCVVLSSMEEERTKRIEEEVRDSIVITIELVLRAGSCHSCGPTLLMVENEILAAKYEDRFKLHKVLIVDRIIEARKDYAHATVDFDSVCTEKNYFKVHGEHPNSGVYLRLGKLGTEFISLKELRDSAKVGVLPIIKERLRRHAVLLTKKEEVVIDEGGDNVLLNPRLEMVRNDTAVIVNYKGTDLYLVSPLNGCILKRLTVDYRLLPLSLRTDEEPITNYSSKDVILKPKEAVLYYTAVYENGEVVAVVLAHYAKKKLHNNEMVVAISPLVYVIRIDVTDNRIISSLRVSSKEIPFLDPTESFICRGNVYFTSRKNYTSEGRTGGIVVCSVETGMQLREDVPNEPEVQSNEYKHRVSFIAADNIYMYTPGINRLYEYSPAMNTGNGRKSIDLNKYCNEWIQRRGEKHHEDNRKIAVLGVMFTRETGNCLLVALGDDLAIIDVATGNILPCILSNTSQYFGIRMARYLGEARNYAIVRDGDRYKILAFCIE